MRYHVPLLTQSVSPICWVVCAAMIQKYWQQKAGNDFDTTMLTGGADPTNSCMPGSSSYAAFTQGLQNAGFTAIPKPAGIIKSADISRLLTENGPLLLDHECLNFNYGPGFGKITATSDIADGAHAVVIVGISGTRAYFNNPWGYKDANIPANDLVASIRQAYSNGRITLAYPTSSVMFQNVVE
jgi:Papain-like cysteine protease AvrRpt2